MPRVRAYGFERGELLVFALLCLVSALGHP